MMDVLRRIAEPLRPGSSDEGVGILILRGVVAAIAALLGAAVRPPTLNPFNLSGPLAGLLVAGVIFAIERALRTLALRTLVAGLAGLFVGGMAATVLLALLPVEAIPGVPAGIVRGFVLLLCAHTGVVLGSARGDRLSPRSLRAAWNEGADGENGKLLDTSVIIDGRIADVVEAGFIEGSLIVPQFVLRELQAIADSPEALRRNRGRKGLEILQRMKKGTAVRVVVSDADVPGIREVDLKLIELAKRTEARILTNDFNLNKVAELRGVKVLNINVLANALKPVVLPGESMNIFILKEGKEPNQGVGYLDDGTMVVVDNAKRFLGRNIPITVTSVLQTTAGKMFFGRCEGAEENAPTELRPRRPGA